MWYSRGCNPTRGLAFDIDAPAPSVTSIDLNGQEIKHYCITCATALVISLPSSGPVNDTHESSHPNWNDVISSAVNIRPRHHR